jgi:LmbE family N-acetylglucosaminyl deacetylase
MTPKTILAIGAHPDDIELGVGGSIAKFVEAGAHVRALVLTKGEVGNRSTMSRIDETKEALKHLGVSDIFTEDFPDTKLHEQFTEVIGCIERHVREHNPERVYTMFRDDTHQDHRTVFKASTVACRGVRQIFCYETPSSLAEFQPKLFESIDGFLDRKITALGLHVSQRDRFYTQPDAMRALAIFRGLQRGVRLAEQKDTGPAEGFIGYRVDLSD